MCIMSCHFSFKLQNFQRHDTREFYSKLKANTDRFLDLTRNVFSLVVSRTEYEIF